MQFWTGVTGLFALVIASFAIGAAVNVLVARLLGRVRRDAPEPTAG